MSSSNGQSANSAQASNLNSTINQISATQAPCKLCHSTENTRSFTIVPISEWKPTKKTEPFYDWVKDTNHWDTKANVDAGSSKKAEWEIKPSETFCEHLERIKENKVGSTGGVQGTLHIGNSPMLGLR